jgi:hypothetical protein
MGIDMIGALESYGGLLAENGDVSLAPDIPKRKLRNALRTYGRPLASPENVLLLVDNTLLRSAKDGLLITPDHLLGRSGPGGVVAVRLSEIHSVLPDLRSLAGFPLPGIIINDEHFIALPGLVREIETVGHSGIVVLAAVFVQALGLRLHEDSDPNFRKLHDNFKKDNFRKG